ncbi:trihelix transcription factor ASIL2-like [Cynara cardunculus var. scolymus]|uniref:trihelix transcription factor ASIL2-like n=1 Tax=Cynara cardunculus var. scolymus TaxID=59895 RepID=UPI000D62AE42|nr:trihelix transcription factor ASIL2-like [Cynara cardunculus var. scolymus]
MSVAAGQKPVRKFPPPCWTRDEALVLIEAYRERWYALHRAFLRTPDWDAVAEKVTTSCPDVIPPKTSAQCRHKMEKLRQRHRAEKQRASAFSGERFFSSWFYFEAMEAMENGSNSEPGSNHLIDSQIPSQNLNSDRGIRFKPSAVQNLVTLATSSTRNSMKSKLNSGSRVSKRYPSYPNNGSIHEEDECLVETPIEETSIPNKESKTHKDGWLIEAPVREAKPPKNSPIQDSSRPGLRPRKFSKSVDEDEEMWIKVPKKTSLSSGKHENEKNGKDLKQGKKKKTKNDGISEMVSSIKLLGDGFMKMEKMKIDMAREIEKMRMETEMKRNELMMESQKQIMDAFVNGLMESRKQKQPTTMADL